MRFASLLLTLLLGISTASAQERAVEADRPLATFRPEELRQLAPLLDGGVVSLVEWAYGTELPAVVIACRVDAPVDVVAAVIGDPARYPDFMAALDGVTVTSEELRGDVRSLAYEWAWQASVFTLHGENTMEAYAPPAEAPERGYRFVVRSTGGDLGVGRTVWRVLPDGSGSLVMSSSRMDLRDANYIARSLAAASSSVNRSINVALAFSMVTRTRAEAERRHGRSRAHLPTLSGEPAPLAFDATRIEDVLMRGDLLWVETTDGTDQGRVVAFTRLSQRPDQVRAAILDPAGFTNGMLSGAHANILEAGEAGTRFEWGIDLPLVGTSGEMRMSERSDGVLCLDATSGALSGAAWRYETLPRSYGTLLTAWGTFDLASGLWLVDVVQGADPSFRPGLSASAELMMVRGLRYRLDRG
jgi:carbon monoxide dehydrogenase subunit G